MTTPASSIVDINRSDFGDVDTATSQHLTIHSFRNGTMSLVAESKIHGEGPYVINIMKLGDRTFSIDSDFSVDACAQQIGGIEVISEGQRTFLTEVQSAIQYEINDKKRFERVVRQHHEKRQRQAEVARRRICQKVLDASRGLGVKDTLDKDELKIYQRFSGYPDEAHYWNRLAQASVTLNIHLTEMKRQLLVEMIHNEVAKGNTA